MLEEYIDNVIVAVVLYQCCYLVMSLVAWSSH